MKSTDAIVKAILDQTPRGELSAETVNALHSCRSDHPWGRNRNEMDRTQTAVAACAGRAVDPILKDALNTRLSRISKGLS